MTSLPFDRIAVDANALASAALGRAAHRIFLAPGLRVVTTDVNFFEAKKVVTVLAEKYGLDPQLVGEHLRNLPVEIHLVAAYQPRLEEARGLIGQRDPSDAPLLALAISLGAPIWSNDRDFEGLPPGVADVYPTARLLKLLFP